MRGTAKLDVGEASATSGMSRVQKREREIGEKKREHAEAWGRRESWSWREVEVEIEVEVEEEPKQAR